MCEQIPVKLAYMIFVEGGGFEGREDRLHHLGIASDFLFVAAGERADPQVYKQPLDLAVTQLGALDAGR